MLFGCRKIQVLERSQSERNATKVVSCADAMILVHVREKHWIVVEIAVATAEQALVHCVVFFRRVPIGVVFRVRARCRQRQMTCGAVHAAALVLICIRSLHLMKNEL